MAASRASRPAVGFPQGVPTRGEPLVYPPVDVTPTVGSGHAVVGAAHGVKATVPGDTFPSIYRCSGPWAPPTNSPTGVPL
jgi:hypothetical protein